MHSSVIVLVAVCFMKQTLLFNKYLTPYGKTCIALSLIFNRAANDISHVKAQRLKK